LLQIIELKAGEAFYDLDMADIATDEPADVSQLAEYLADDRLWVCVDEQDQPVGYVQIDVVDGCAHIEQVSVHPDHAGKRLGRKLIDRVESWAAQRGLAALTLTTFRDVPWNAPYYQRCGFRLLDAQEIGRELAEIRREEAAHGLDRWPRVCMRRELSRH